MAPFLAAVLGPVLAAFCVWLGRVTTGIGKAKRAEKEAQRKHERERDEADRELRGQVLAITHALSGRPPTAFEPGTTGVIQDLAAVSKQIREHGQRDEELFEKVAERLDAGDKRMTLIERRIPG